MVRQASRGERRRGARAVSITVVALVALVATACSTGAGSSSPAESMPMDSGTAMDSGMPMDSGMAMGSMGEEEFDFGEPADAADADRVVDIVAHDNYTFDPDEITVAVGETVTFRVRNPGAVAHEIVLGAVDLQEEHEEEMQAMGDDMMMHDEANAITVESGETKELTWTFTKAGTYQYACHEQPDHYANGMFGTITVTAS